ncbi:poly-beta-1,6-N-acetyl-D-glucosamine biosynthesis protein PgaD [Mariprofundus sp. EBB-1]|uniref:poly-beta-1,6-N-acetyl-D-glucosamine biosynthesis protein PgaD n=1 Tax=Mariprofundus sp. EBB-1 TaxID=2650971 RepID=UPI000EF1F12D|nr:poly-beta-1,6-N-acetyl-D-glucosamine biosynthesis protein PgaD [Mariprofundus sp. EBB-1]RLL54073.1 poly-beta-1,6-N-acetyl-D-glucosamine biosynthesis protein PgaD [Mariprofundus sp. EBB-1]
MAKIHIITKPELKSDTRSLTELGITGIVWGLWLYLFLPIANVLLWVVGISTFQQEFITEGGIFVFIELIQQMGWVILAAFIIMRLWGVYNYYHFGRHDKRTHEMPDSTEKLCHFYQLKPDELVAIENRKETIWPTHRTPENVKEWLRKKAAHLSPEQIHEDDGNIFMQFHEVHDEHKELSITSATTISILSVFTLAVLLLYAAGGLGLSEKSDSTTTVSSTMQQSPADSANPSLQTEALMPQASAPVPSTPIEAASPQVSTTTAQLESKAATIEAQTPGSAPASPTEPATGNTPATDSSTSVQLPTAP